MKSSTLAAPARPQPEASAEALVRRKRRAKRRRAARRATRRAALLGLAMGVVAVVLAAWFGVIGGPSDSGALVVQAPALAMPAASPPPADGFRSTAGGLAGGISVGPAGGDGPTAADAAGGRPDGGAPTGDLKVAQPVPLDRGARVSRVMAPDEAPPPNPAGDPTKGPVSFANGRGMAQIGGAPVAEKDLGVRFYPSARVEAGDATIVQDAESGSTQSIGLVSRDPFDKVAAFYRDQLRGAGAGPRESAAAPGQVLLEATDPGNGSQRTVLIWRDGDDVRITLSRWVPIAKSVRRG